MSVNMRTWASSSAMRRELEAAQRVPQFGQITPVDGTSLSMGAASMVSGGILKLGKRSQPCVYTVN